MGNKKLLLAVWLICLCVCIGFAAHAAYRFAKDSVLVPVSATIQRIYTVGMDTNTNNQKIYVEYEYEWEGKTYVSSQQVFSDGGKEVGQTVTVRCHPDNPAELEDPLPKYASVAVSIFLAVILLLLAKPALGKSR